MKPSPSVSLRSTQTIPSQAITAEDVPQASSFWGISFLCALAGIFILYSRFFDMAANGLRIPRIVLSLMILFFLFSGRPTVFLRSVTGKILIVFLFWVSFTLIFSVWKSGSLVPYEQFLQSCLLFAIMAGLPITSAHVTRIMNTLALSGLVAALMSVVWGSDQLGRLALRDGSYLDPNYYALALVVVIPFFWRMAASAESVVGKALAWLCLVPLLVTLARTGSRGAMLGFAVMLLVLFFISSIQTKVVLVLGSAIGLFLVLALMPDYIRNRYLTFFDVDSKIEQQVESTGNLELDRLRADASSAEGRKRLLLTSIALTFEHPLVGVGPGNFPTAVYDASKAAGHPHNEWLVTHNSYTQMSSETGLVGFIIFVALITSSFKNCAFVFGRSKPEGITPDMDAFNSAKYLLLSLAGLSVCIFFLAIGYEFTIYVIAGLTVSVRRAFQERTAASAEAAEALEEPQNAVAPTPYFTPAYAGKIQSHEVPRRGAPVVAGRPVRFNRFR
jgi:O-antigen ligase